LLNQAAKLERRLTAVAFVKLILPDIKGCFELSTILSRDIGTSDVSFRDTETPKGRNRFKIYGCDL